ncbi:MAG: hypothetical protein ACRDZ6_02785 [Acidimicrobiales bacterium]
MSSASFSSFGLGEVGAHLGVAGAVVILVLVGDLVMTGGALAGFLAQIVHASP